MWVPENPEQIERAARAGELTETPSFDAKAALPAPKRNADLAEDVAAMSTDGGVLLYGVGEDEHKQPTIPEPIALANAAERIDNIVNTSISEVPYIDVREYPCAADPSKGYIAVIVPQSARAPHQVTVGGDLRFYGRGAKGNRRLTEGEVARLYQRRGEWAQDRAALLAEVVASADVPRSEGSGHLHAFARPVAGDQGLYERAEARIGRGAMQRHMLAAVDATKLGSDWDPTLRQASYWSRRGADEWRLGTRTEAERTADPRTLSELRVNIDGRGQLFNGRAVDSHPRFGGLVVFELLIAGSLEAFLAIMAMLYEAAGYHGHVDLGVAILGIDGAGSLRRSGDYSFGENFSYQGQAFTRTARVAAAELQQPDRVAHSQLRHFYEATTGREGFDPFAEADAKRAPQRP